MYNINVAFEDSATHQEVASWLDTIVIPSMPEGAKATINLDEVVIDADRLTEDDIGKNIRFTAKHGLEVIGKLDAIFPANQDYARVLVINGVAHHIAFGVVRLSS